MHHFHADLSLAMVFFFFVFFFAVVCWVGSDGQIAIHHTVPSTSHSQIALGFFFFFWWGGGYGLSFMGCNGLMLVGYGGGCGLILVVRLNLDFSYGGRW